MYYLTFWVSPSGQTGFLVKDVANEERNFLTH